MKLESEEERHLRTGGIKEERGRGARRKEEERDRGTGWQEEERDRGTGWQEEERDRGTGWQEAGMTGWLALTYNPPVPLSSFRAQSPPEQQLTRLHYHINHLSPSHP